MKEHDEISAGEVIPQVGDTGNKTSNRVLTTRICGVIGTACYVTIFFETSLMWAEYKPMDLFWQILLWVLLGLFLYGAISNSRIVFVIAIPLSIAALVLFAFRFGHMLSGRPGDNFYWWHITPFAVAFVSSIIGSIAGKIRIVEDHE